MEKTLKKLFITEQKSAPEIAKILGFTTNQIYGKLSKYGIRKNKPRVTQWFNKTLKNLTDEDVYLLGFLWADGYLNAQNAKTNNYHNLQCTIVYNDFLDLKPIFNKVGNWGEYIKEANIKDGVCRQKSIILTISDTRWNSILCSVDFDKKGYASPTKLLKKIPKKKHYLFYRGYVDGDGCFYITDKAKHFFIGSTYNQDWSHIESLFTKLKIKHYKIKKYVSKTGYKDSRIRISSIDGIQKIVKYLYQDRLDMGLKRKYEKVKVYC